MSQQSGSDAIAALDEGQRAEALEISERLNSEIRRGALVLSVLGQLRTEHYGYSLRKTLLEKGLDVEEGTLYPLIRRLEKQGLLNSEWREDNNRRKRFYQLSDVGRGVYQQLLSNWHELSQSVDALTASLQSIEGKENT
ncbi:MAG: helix-turn-helix transcriptional regulator [Pseudomonadales bacterium]